MVAQSPPFALQNAQHSAALFRQAASSPFSGSGVLAPTDFAVSAQSTPNMSVQVSAGRAWIPGTQVANVAGGAFSTQAAYFGLNDAPVTLTVAAADPTNPRVDLVYLAVADSFYSGAANSLTLGIVTGQPAGTPAAPAAPSNALVLATVAVAANATAIGSGNIAATPSTTLLADLRGGVQLCTSTTRPAAPTAGLVIYETNTGREYAWNPALAAGAGAWDQLGGPPEQYSIAFAAGFTTFGSGAAGSWQPATILKRGRECWLIGNIQAGTQTTMAAGTTYTVGTLPSAVQPLTNEQAISTLYQAPGQSSLNVLVNSTSPYNLQVVPIGAAGSGWNASIVGCRWRTNN